MKLLLISVGAVRDTALKELATRFASRIPRYMPFEHVALPDAPATRNSTPESRKAREGELILGRLQPGDFLVLFDERGKSLTSRDFAQLIERKAATLQRNLVFAIGGPYGFSDDVYRRADLKVSLSAMTFTHEMACFIALEQIYRAMTIIRGEPYHHD